MGYAVVNRLADLLFSGEQRHEIMRVAKANPRTLGLHFSRWSLQRLRRYLIDKSIVNHISVETIRQIIQLGEEKINIH